MIAYSSVSHMGLVLLGISALNEIGLMGAVLPMAAHGLITGALFLLIGLLYQRTHTRELSDYGALVRVMPGFSLLMALLAAMGLPGLGGFIAELHVLIGGFERWGWLILLVNLGILISAAYAIRTMGQLFTGPVRPAMSELHDLQPHKWLAAGLMQDFRLGGLVGGNTRIYTNLNKDSVFHTPIISKLLVRIDRRLL